MHQPKLQEAKDSRLFGPVNMTDIVGRVIYRLRTCVDHGCVRNSMLKIWPVLAVELDVEEMSKNHKAQRPVWFAFLLSTQMGKPNECELKQRLSQPPLSEGGSVTMLQAMHLMANNVAGYDVASNADVECQKVGFFRVRVFLEEQLLRFLAPLRVITEFIHVSKLEG
ncbi:hypothetical protein D0Y65_051684 [Glycine soja]|uniref:Uncharacterized protein n=1 Tax=Glycine soja TaxID=3848 RepID=A0A445FHD1_GLYSO|nr:hypothetical protein D0Y65_051684 [Glycine soja]